jgi:hypothetical protein
MKYIKLGVTCKKLVEAEKKRNETKEAYEEALSDYEDARFECRKAHDEYGLTPFWNAVCDSCWDGLSKGGKPNESCMPRKERESEVTNQTESSERSPQDDSPENERKES